MSRKIPQQDLPHYGVKNKLIRDGSFIYRDEVWGQREVKKEIQSSDGESVTEVVMEDYLVVKSFILECSSVSKAKRFMRTGKENRR